ncbi:transcriptional repressor [Shimia abyssi]|uniref:Fur family zinc uptake transcriptional regulator n=1 Tax=Shimia abyssi TaxID=1662395 RepID=A0A2P8FBP9_9RHOB|nr:transcriptional repressor [Shimia abyssi]PSL19156.1 Fur family zinc uptake transcriptional regulator [Shimia abyssi]
MSEIGFGKHDHSACISGALEAAEQVCSAQGLRLTKGRRRVLEILVQEHRAMGAYDILAVLSDEGFGAQPPVVYRALEFLVSNGFAHKIEKLNAYVACSHPQEGDHAPVFLICKSCGIVAEGDAPKRKSDLQQQAQESGFVIETTVMEAEGLCPTCVPGGEA